MNRKLFLLLTACLLFLTACTQKMNPVNPTDTPAPTGTPILTPTPTPTPRIALEKQVSYDTVTVNGLQEIQCGEDKGIALDLNGDGAVEQIYLAPEGIYINNYLEELNYSWENAGVSYWEKFWIVDLNTADNYINLIVRFDDGDDTEALVYYDGSLRELARLDCFGGNSAYSTAEYNGDGTFVVQSRQQNLMNMSYFSPVTYSLNEDNRIIQLDEFVQLKQAYPLELLKELEMYQEPVLGGEQMSVSPQTVKALATSKNWVQFQLENGTEGWVYVEYIAGEGWIVNQEEKADALFSGFSTAG